MVPIHWIRHTDAPRRIQRAALPPALRQLAEDDPALTATAHGNPDLLKRTLVGFFCSEAAPGNAVLGTYDLALALRDSDATFIGGFQSAMEKEFLTFLLRGSASVIVCPARGIGGIRVPALWRAPLEAGRMLVLSIFNDNVSRPTRQTVAERNSLIGELAACLLVPHAQPGGKVERLCENTLEQGKPVFTLFPTDSPLVQLGAMVLTIEELLIKLQGELEGLDRRDAPRACS